MDHDDTPRMGADHFQPNSRFNQNRHLLGCVLLIHVDSKSRYLFLICRTHQTRSCTHSPVPLRDVDARWLVRSHASFGVQGPKVSSNYGPSGLGFLGCKICTAKLLRLIYMLHFSEQLSWASTLLEKKTRKTLLVFSLRGGQVTRPFGTLRIR